MPHDDDGHDDLFVPIAESLPKIKPPSRVKRRLIESAVEIADDDPESLLFQHTVFCQVGLPYRDPGNHVREWDRKQGFVHLQVEAGKALHFDTGEWVKLGLPWGPKPRLILAHLNAEALRHGSPEIDVGDSLTGFVKRIRGFDGGREIRMFKDQLGRLSAALVRLAMMHDGRGFQINTQIVTAFDLWFPKDERQRVLWPSTVRLSHEYFESLRKHAVPLDERALAALAHSAMALDVYSWLAQRLHRVHPFQPQFIPWTAVKAQFGFGYGRMDNFKRRFRLSLQAVLSQYRAARVELDDHGMTLRHSRPPVKGRIAVTAPPNASRSVYIHAAPRLSACPRLPPSSAIEDYWRDVCGERRWQLPRPPGTPPPISIYFDEAHRGSDHQPHQFLPATPSTLARDPKSPYPIIVLLTLRLMACNWRARRSRRTRPWL